MPASIAATAEETTVLADGTAVRLRPLGRGERDLVAGFFAGLSAQSRRRRFLQAMPRLPEAMLRHLVHVDDHRHVAVVAEAGGRPPASPASWPCPTSRGWPRSR